MQHPFSSSESVSVSSLNFCKQSFSVAYNLVKSGELLLVWQEVLQLKRLSLAVSQAVARYPTLDCVFSKDILEK